MWSWVGGWNWVKWWEWHGRRSVLFSGWLEARKEKAESVNNVWSCMYLPLGSSVELSYFHLWIGFHLKLHQRRPPKWSLFALHAMICLFMILAILKSVNVYWLLVATMAETWQWGCWVRICGEKGSMGRWDRPKHPGQHALDRSSENYWIKKWMQRK